MHIHVDTWNERWTWVSFLFLEKCLFSIFVTHSSTFTWGEASHFTLSFSRPFKCASHARWSALFTFCKYFAIVTHSLCRRGTETHILTASFVIAGETRVIIGENVASSLLSLDLTEQLNASESRHRSLGDKQHMYERQSDSQCSLIVPFPLSLPEQVISLDMIFEMKKHFYFTSHKSH